MPFLSQSAGENGWIRQPFLRCSDFLLGALTNDFEGDDRFTLRKLDEVYFAVALDGGLHPGRERVHARSADTMQSTGGLIAFPLELATCMEFGKRHFDAGFAGLSVDVDRNTT